MSRAVVMGIGNRLRGDDAVGCLVIDELEPGDDLKVIDGGTSPENYIGPIVDFTPARILLVDACAFDGQPGEFRLFNRAELDRLAAGMVSTHTLPLTMTVVMIEQQSEASIEFLGVQPVSLEFDAGLSQPVASTLPDLVDYVRRWVDLKS
jgi:hydrogenase maturation protease